MDMPSLFHVYSFPLVLSHLSPFRRRRSHQELCERLSDRIPLSISFGMIVIVFFYRCSAFLRDLHVSDSDVVEV